MNRNRLRNNLNSSRRAAAAELSIVVLLSGVLFWISVLQNKPFFSLLSALTAWFFAGGFLYLRGKNWGFYGFRKPKKWRPVLLSAAGGTIGLHILIGLLLEPLVTHLTGRAVDLSAFEAVKGNALALIIGLGVVWTQAAFIEEMLFRGYLLNRISDLFSHRKTGLWTGIILSSVLFGIGHQYQGVSGMILTGAAGFYFAWIYLLSGKNLAAVILAHGLYNTSALLLIYLT